MEYVTWKTFEQYDGWVQRQKTYGNAFKLKKSYIMLLITIVCLITPFTNWLIPIAQKHVKSEIILRWS